MALKKVEICGVNTSKLPVLSEKEKEELFEKLQKGDMVARAKYLWQFKTCVKCYSKIFKQRRKP